MKLKRPAVLTILALILLLVVAAAVAVLAFGNLQLMDRLNLKGEQRYTVSDQVYGVVETGFDESSFRMTIEPRIPNDQADDSGVDAIEKTEGIALVDAAGERFALTEVVLRSSAGEQGRGQIVLLFDLSEYGSYPGSARWTLEWPGHEPQPVSDGDAAEAE